MQLLLLLLHEKQSEKSSHRFFQVETFSSPEFIKKHYLISSTVSSQQQFKATADVTRMNEGWIWWIYEMSWIHICCDYLKRFSRTWCNFSLEILSQSCLGSFCFIFVRFAGNKWNLFLVRLLLSLFEEWRINRRVKRTEKCTLKGSPLVWVRAEFLLLTHSKQLD